MFESNGKSIVKDKQTLSAWVKIVWVCQLYMVKGNVTNAYLLDCNVHTSECQLIHINFWAKIVQCATVAGSSTA